MKKLTKDKEFPDRLRSLIVDRLKITQSDFCKRHQLTTGYLSMILSGKRGPSADLMAIIVMNYSEHVHWLLTGKNEEETDCLSQNEPTFLLTAMAALFRQKDLAYGIIEALLSLEKKAPSELREVKAFIEYRLFRKDAVPPPHSDPKSSGS